MYDDTEPDTARITVIATGLETAASAGQGTSYAKKTEKPSFTGAPSNFRSNAGAAPSPSSFAPRRESTIQIPSFLQKK